MPADLFRSFYWNYFLENITRCSLPSLGYQSRLVFCTIDNEAYPDYLCASLPRPQTNRTCNPQPCPQVRRWISLKIHWWNIYIEFGRSFQGHQHSECIIVPMWMERIWPHCYCLYALLNDCCCDCLKGWRTCIHHSCGDPQKHPEPMYSGNPGSVVVVVANHGGDLNQSFISLKNDFQSINNCFSTSLIGVQSILSFRHQEN